jgi:hypothetical protein
MFELIVYFLLSLSFGLLLYFYLNKQLLDNLNIYYLVLLFGLGALSELSFSIILNFDSQYWFKIYSYLEFLTLLLFFRKLIGITQSVFYFIIILYSIIYAFLAVMFFNKININLFELFIPIANCLLVFTGSTKWTIQQFEKLETSSLLHFPVFYILSGMILYYSGTFFIFGLETIFRYTKSPVLLYFWYINLLLLFIYRLSFYIAIWKAKKV